MKKFLTFALVCCLVFSSSSTVFADATQWDTSDQANLRYIYQSVTSGGSLYNLVNNIYSRLNTINNNLVDIKGYLVHGSNSIATLIYNIQTWMSPLYNAVTQTPLDLQIIQGLLGYPTTDSGTGVTSWNSYLKILSDGIKTYISSVPTWNGNGWTISAGYGNFYDSLVRNTNSLIEMKGYEDSYYLPQFLSEYNNSQSPLNWLDLQVGSMTPSSGFDGIYKWLANIQHPVARLSYVLASDERIEAQEAASANEEAVVDNFIDSSGSGATSASDISSVSNLSSGFKNNISTDASVSGIWNIFNSDNFGWFSQETADQLDTTGSRSRMLKSSGSYPTPLLDKQTEDIFKYIGGDDND